MESAEFISDAAAGSLPICSSSGETNDVLMLPVETESAAPDLLENFLNEFQNSIASEVKTDATVGCEATCSSAETSLVLMLPVESEVAAPNLFEEVLDGFEKNNISEIEKTNNENHEVIDCTIKLAQQPRDSEHSLSDVDSDTGSLYQLEESASSSSDESESKVTEVNHPTEILVGEPTGIKRKRKGQRNEEEWKRQKNAKLRLLGKAYVGFEKDPDTGKYEQKYNKSHKIIGSRCSGHYVKCKKGGPRQSFKCNEITDDQRGILFRTFWAKSSWESKQTYVVENALPQKPKYPNADLTNDSRKKNTYRFSFTVNSEKKQVCKQMFLNTLSIGEKQLRSWTLRKSPASSESSEACSSAGPNNQLFGISKDIETWLNSLPKIESHYCRSSTSKLYLEPVWYSVREMHRVYQVEYKKTVSWHTFQKIYKKMNLSIYAPNKDQCNECTLYKNGTLDEESFQKHIKKMKDANAAKESDKSMALTDKDTKCYTVDLQAVILSPRLNAPPTIIKPN